MFLQVFVRNMKIRNSFCNACVTGYKRLESRMRFDLDFYHVRTFVAMIDA